MKSQIKRESKYSSPTLKRQGTSAVGGGATSWGGGYAGNLATADYLSSQAAPAEQSMTVSEPNEASEQAADSNADRVMRVIGRSPAERGGLHRSADGIGGSAVSPGLQSGIESAKSGPASSLPAGLAGSMGGAMGCTFNDVRVHDDSSSHAMSRDLHAGAFTSGKDIFFGRGAYQPDSSSGQRLIAHELTHVAQEDSGLYRSSVIRRSDPPDPNDPNSQSPSPPQKTQEELEKEKKEEEERLRLEEETKKAALVAQQGGQGGSPTPEEQKKLDEEAAEKQRLADEEAEKQRLATEAAQKKKDEEEAEAKKKADEEKKEKINNAIVANKDVLALFSNPLIVRLIKLVARINKTTGWDTVDVGSGDQAGANLDLLGSALDLGGNVADLGSSALDAGSMIGKEGNVGAGLSGIGSGLAGAASGGLGMASAGVGIASTGKDIREAHTNKFAAKKGRLTSGTKNEDLKELQEGDYEGPGGQGTNAARLVGGSAGLVGGASSAIGGLLFGTVGSGMGMAKKEGVRDTGGIIGGVGSGLSTLGSGLGTIGSAVNTGADATDYFSSLYGRHKKGGDTAKLAASRAAVDTALGNNTSLTADDKIQLKGSLKKGPQKSVNEIRAFMKTNDSKLNSADGKPLKNALSRYLMSLQMEHKSGKDSSQKGWSMGGGIVDTLLGTAGTVGGGFSTAAAFTSGTLSKVFQGIGAGIGALTAIVGGIKNAYQVYKKGKKAKNVNSDDRKSKYRQRVLDVIGAMGSLASIVGDGGSMEVKELDACATYGRNLRVAAAADAAAAKANKGKGTTATPTAVNVPAGLDEGVLNKLSGASESIAEYKTFYDNMNGTVNMLDLCTAVDDLDSITALEDADKNKVAQAIAGGLGM